MAEPSALPSYLDFTSTALSGSCPSGSAVSASVFGGRSISSTSGESPLSDQAKPSARSDTRVPPPRHSLYQGRPSLIHRDNWNALLLSIDDFDPPAPTTATPGSTTSGGGSHVQLSQPAIDSADSFIALSSLTLILDDILAEFFTCRAQARAAAGVGPRGKGSSRAGRSSRLRVIESFGGDLDRFQRELKPGVKAGSREGSVVPTGISQCQVGLPRVLALLNLFLTSTDDQSRCSSATLVSLYVSCPRLETCNRKAHFFLQIVLGRLTLDLFDPEDPGDAQDVSAAVESSLECVP